MVVGVVVPFALFGLDEDGGFGPGGEDGVEGVGDGGELTWVMATMSELK